MTLEPLLGLPPDEQRARVLALCPDGADPNWWLGLVQQAMLRAGDAPDSAAPAWAALADVVTDLARGHLDDRELVTRRAYLSARRPTMVDPDAAARACLALAAETPEAVAAVPWAPRHEDLEVMRRLRRIRNVVTPATHLIDLVTDAGLRDELAAWVRVLPTLP